MHKASHRIFITLAIVAAHAVAGCSVWQSKNTQQYETMPSNARASTSKARKLNDKGLWHFRRGEFDAAEKQFQDALIADVNFGPAHNNLGLVFFATHRLYLAAWEFEFASRIMPERFEPKVNIGMAYELAGRHERALEFYEAAYADFPAESESIGSLARILIKLDSDPDRIRFLLGEVVFHDDRPSWVQWAEELLATRFDINRTLGSPPPRELAGPDRYKLPEEISAPLPIELQPAEINKSGTHRINLAPPMDLGRGHSSSLSVPTAKGVRQASFAAPTPGAGLKVQEGRSAADFPTTIQWDAIIDAQ